jgi:hypothetical protein
MAYLHILLEYCWYTLLKQTLILTAYFLQNWDSSVSIEMAYKTGQSGFDFWQGQEIFHLSIVARLALGLTQPPIRCVPEALSPGIKQ